MALHTTKPVTIVHSKPIKKGRTNKRELEIYKHKKKAPKVIRGEILQKTIHMYRMWFLFLKLGLELEEQKAALIVKESARVVNENGRHTTTERITKKVVVNKKKYEEWDLEHVLVHKFDDWWFGNNGCTEHRHLFVDEVSNVLNVDDDVSSNPNHITIQFDKRTRLIDVIDDLRQMNEQQKLFNHTAREKFNINSRVRYDTLLNRYNCLVLKLKDEMTNEEIITHPLQYIRQTDNGNSNGYGGVHYGRTVFDLISGTKRSYGAKQILLSVCDGYFVKHPTKTYLD